MTAVILPFPKRQKYPFSNRYVELMCPQELSLFINTDPIFLDAIGEDIDAMDNVRSIYLFKDNNTPLHIHGVNNSGVPVVSFPIRLSASASDHFNSGNTENPSDIRTDSKRVYNSQLNVHSV